MIIFFSSLFNSLNEETSRKETSLQTFYFYFFEGNLVVDLCYRWKPHSFSQPLIIFSLTLSQALKASFGRRTWKGMKRIILEYFSLPLFGSLSRREWNGQERTLIPLYSLKTSNFHSPRNWKEWKGMKLNLMIFLLKLPKYPCIFNSLF